MRTRVNSLLGILSLMATLGLAACGGGDADDGGPACADGTTDCEGLCLDTRVDPDNCGACGSVCGDGYECAEGACVSICEEREQFCGGACINPEDNRDYCGATDCAGGQTGEACAANYDCVGGACSCERADYTECGPGVCVNLNEDINNCGICGTRCDTANGASCIDGICRAAVTYAGTLAPQNGRWDFAGNIGLEAGDAECEVNWPNSTVCTAIELVYAGLEGQVSDAVDINGDPVVSWWNNDDAAGDETQCVFTTMENVRWSYETAHVGNGGSYYVLQPDGTLSDLYTDAVCGDTHSVACCYRAIAID